MVALFSHWKLPSQQRLRLSYILVMDSGLGGLTVAEAIQRKNPGLSCIYFADLAGFPYGSKSSDFVSQRVASIVDYAYRNFDIAMAVVACNTASTQVLPELRQRYQIPIVGVVPAIKPAAAGTKLKTIGILATPQTIVRAYTDQLIADHAAGLKVIRVGSQRLVEIAENSLRGGEVSESELREICAPFFAGSKRLVDTVVLGCTHFPLLKTHLQSAVSSKIKWVDSGQAIAQRVFHLVEDLEDKQKLFKNYQVFLSSEKLPHKLKEKLASDGWLRFETVTI